MEEDMSRKGIDRYIYNSPEELKEEFGGDWNLVYESDVYSWSIDKGCTIQYTMSSHRFIIINGVNYDFGATYKAVKKFIKIHHELRAFK